MYGQKPSKKQIYGIDQIEKDGNVLLQSEILRVRNSVIEISRTRETRSQLRMERHKKKLLFLYHQILLISRAYGPDIA